MSVMCSLAVCKAQQGMCGHEKVMLSVAVLAAVGLAAVAGFMLARESNLYAAAITRADRDEPAVAVQGLHMVCGANAR